MVLVAAATTFSVSCADRAIQSVLHPKSSQAAEIALLWWVMLGVFTVVLLIVMTLVVAAVTRRQSGNPTELSEKQKRNLVATGGVIIPVVIIFIFIVYSVSVGRYTASVPERTPITIEVIGHQWWWDIRYRVEGKPHLDIRTANEIHIPVGIQVKFVLESRDVIHSFWMPNFQGKVDLIPGRKNFTWVTSTESGVFRGQCAEFCGLQHAKMAFVVVSKPEHEFYAWLETQAQPAREPVTELEKRGRDIFETTSCALCHSIRGTQALAQIAPDLTHLGSRQTLAAGSLPNTRGHLGGWLANPQQIKRGSRMPNLYLNNTELEALIAYLESLQ